MPKATARVVIVVVLATIGLAPRAGAQVAIAAGLNQYVTPAVVVASTDHDVTFVNADINRHNVVAFEATRKDSSAAWCSGFSKGRCPLFWSATIGAGATTPVLGLADAVANTPYSFYCTIHPWMKGTVAVLDG